MIVPSLMLVLALIIAYAALLTIELTGVRAIVEVEVRPLNITIMPHATSTSTRVKANASAHFTTNRGEEGLFEGLIHLTAALPIALILVLTALVISLIAIFGYVVPAFSLLREYDPGEYGTPAALVKVGYVGGLVVVALGVLLLFIGALGGLGAFTLTGLPVVVVGAILLIIGYIGLLIGLFKFRSTTSEELFLAAAILMIIGLFIKILELVGWILVFIAAGSPLKRVQTRPQIAL